LSADGIDLVSEEIRLEAAGKETFAIDFVS
jgi:hypothetical protein